MRSCLHPRHSSLHFETTPFPYMYRRSRRLFEAGYYNDDRSPRISYRETMYRIFRRRIGRRHNRDKTPDHHVEVFYDAADNTESIIITTKDTQSAYATTSVTRDTPTQRTPRHTFSSVTGAACTLLLLLGFGILIHMNVQLREEVQSLRDRMNTFAPVADSIPNFALESQGARVWQDFPAETYTSWKALEMIKYKICSWWYPYNPQRRVIQGHSTLLPGQCWCFPGDREHLVISLSHPITVTHVTLGHITKSQSPYNNIPSAPREFSIYGWNWENKEVFLGKLVYNQNGPAFQTFEVPHQDKGFFSYVKLQIENNWGNIDYTCLYNFRIHGKTHF